MRINIYTFGGVVSYAHHYFAQIHEEDNPLWDGRTEAEASPEWYAETLARHGGKLSPESEAHFSRVCGWVEPFDDLAGRGRQLHSDRFETKSAAWDWVASCLKRSFKDFARYEFHVYDQEEERHLRYLLRKLGVSLRGLKFVHLVEPIDDTENIAALREAGCECQDPMVMDLHGPRGGVRCRICGTRAYPEE